MEVFRMVGAIALKGGRDATKELEQFDSKGRTTSSTIERLGQVSEATGRLMKKAFIGALAGATALTAGIVKLVGEAGEMEVVSVAYEVLIGDVEKANKVIADLKAFSAKTPLSFADITKAGKTLMAFGSEAEQVQGQIAMLGDLAMGNAQKLESLTRAYGKVQAKGKVTMEELNIVTEAGVPILEALAKQQETNVDGVIKFVTTGKIGYEELTQAMRDLTSEGGQFSGMMEKQSQTFQGLMSSMKDNLSILMSELGNRLMPLIKPLIGNVTLYFNRMVEDLTSGTGAITTLAKALESIVGWFVEVADTSMKVASSIPIVWSFMVGAFGLVVGKIKEKLKGPTEAILAFTTSITEWFGESGLKESVSTVWSFTLQMLGEGWTFITETALPWIGATVTTAWNMTISLLGATATWLETYVFPWLGKTASTVWSWTVNLAEDLMPVVKEKVSTAWEWTVSLVGETYEALKKGFETNDWSDLFGVAIDLSQIALKVAVTWVGLSTLAGTLISGIQTGLSGLGLAMGAIGKLGTGGTIALLSVGVALTEAVNEGGEAWGAFAKNMISALTVALVAGGLTKSVQVGALAFNIAINFKLGEMLFGKGTFFDQFIQRLFPDDVKTSMMEKTIKSSITDPLAVELNKIPDQFSAIDILKKWSLPAVKAEALLNGTEIGRQLVAGLELSEGEIEEFAKVNAQAIIDSFKNVLGIKSPSREFFEIAMQVIQGFINGMGDKFPELAELAKTMMEDLKGIWIELEEDAGEVADAVVEEVVAPKRKSKVWAFFKDMGKGIWNGLKGSWDFLGDVWGAVSDYDKSLGNIWKDLKELSVDAFFAIDDAIMKMLDGMKSIPGAFATFGKELVGGLIGTIVGGSSLAGGVEGFRSGMEKYRKTDEDGNPEKGISASMLGGGLAGMAVGLAGQSEQFQELMEKLEPVIGKVVDLFGRLIEPLMPLVDVLANVLEPLLVALQPLIDVLGKMLFDVFAMLLSLVPPIMSILGPILEGLTLLLEHVVMPALKFLYKAIAWIYNGIAGAVNKLVSAIDGIPGVRINWRMPTMDTDLPTPPQPSTSTTEEKESKYSAGGGGTQVSNITGATRDLLVDLLSPLARLDGLTGIGERIYNLLDARLGNTGVNIEAINIYGDAEIDAEELAGDIEEILAGRIAFAMGGNT